MDYARFREGLNASIFSLRFYLMNLDIATLPSIDIEARKNLPIVTAVYFAFTEKPLYIGQAVNLNSRWQNHHQLKNALEVKAKIAWLELEPVNLTPVESILIQIHRPIWNTSGKPSADDFLLRSNSKRFEGMWR